MPDFATVAELEEFIGTQGLGTRATAMLGYASAEIRRYTGQDIEETTGRQEEREGQLYPYYFRVKQHPVTAITLALDGEAYEDFTWTENGLVWRTGSTWEGVLVATYDSGYDEVSDEFQAVKVICLEVAARALTGPALGGFESLESAELRGASPQIFLTDGEMQRLDGLAMVTVG